MSSRTAGVVLGVVLVVDDVDRAVLGGGVRALLELEDVALLGLVLLGGLLRRGRPVGVVDISFRHLCSLPLS